MTQHRARDNRTGEDYIQCMTAAAFASDDIILDNWIFFGVFNIDSLTHDSFQITPYSENYYEGLVQYVQPRMIDGGSESPFTYLGINLNSNLSYKIFLSDPILQPITESTDEFPRLVLSLEPKAGNIEFYFKVIYVFLDFHFFTLPPSPGHQACEVVSALRPLLPCPRVQLYQVCGEERDGEGGLPAALVQESCWREPARLR